MTETRTFKTSDRTSLAKKLLCEEHGIIYKNRPPKEATQLINSFNGITIEEMKESAKIHNINVNIYEYKKEKNIYDIQEQWHNTDDENKTFFALLYSNDKVIHIIYIINAESLTNIHICPKCGSYIHKGNKNIERFKNHVKNCNRKFKKDFIPSHEALPYVPHILSNPLYLYCLSYNIEWKPTIHYITYDFETMEKKINKNISDSTTINSKLIPLSVASCVKLDKGLITKNFDIINNVSLSKNMMELIIESLVTILRI